MKRESEKSGATHSLYRGKVASRRPHIRAPRQGKKTDYVARQYLGSVGKIDNGIVSSQRLWSL